MTAAENMAITARTGKPFTFKRKREGAADVEFYPGAGSRLRFANRDVDTLVARDLPAGLLQAGDEVAVQYKGVTVFVGEVGRIVDARGKGDERVQTVTVAGPWDRMNRLVFRQAWSVAGAGEEGAALEFSSSRVILGQTAEGLEQTMAEQLGEILAYAASRCGFSLGTVDALAQYLPLDEARDITCADAVRRELRFFPKRIVRFDYSGATPEIEIVEPSSTDAAYVADIPKTERTYEYNAHPVSCVDVAVDATDVVVGGTSASYHQVYPADGDVDDLDCLHVTVPLERGSSSTTTESFRSVTEDIPADLNDKSWWKQKHPRLANVALSAITITENCRRTGADHDYPRIAKSTRGEIEAAGLHCELVRYSCKVKIATADDEEEDIALTMDFLTTDAKTKTYTWQTGSSSTAGETLPEGLAQALYEQRAQSLVNERMTVRLGDTFPQLGDAADGLYLQSFEVDVYDLTAQLSFGQPEHLSAEDMKSLLNGFRQRGFATTARLREEAADEDSGEDDDAPGGIPPIASSEWSPGTKAKTTIKGAQGGPIELDSAMVTDGTMKVRTLTLKKEDGGTETVQYLATSDATVEGEKEEPDDGDGEGDGHCVHPGSHGEGGVPADDTDAHGWGSGIGGVSGDGGVPADDNHGNVIQGKPCNCE